MQRGDKTAGAKLNVLRRNSQSCVNQRGIREQTAKLMKVALRCPDTAESILICKPCGLNQQLILTAIRLLIGTGKEHDSKIHSPSVRHDCQKPASQLHLTPMDQLSHPDQDLTRPLVRCAAVCDSHVVAHKQLATLRRE